MTRQIERIPMSVFDDQDDGNGEIDIAFDWTPGQAPSGLTGPPENYDPGSGDEFDLLGASGVKWDGTSFPFMLCAEWEAKIVEYLNEEWERPDFAAERADYEYDRYRDEMMERRA